MTIAVRTQHLIRVKDRFQVTIPAKLRQHLNIFEGDFLEMRFVDGEIRIKPRAKPVAERSGADWYRDYLSKLAPNAEADALTDEDVTAMIKALR